MCEHQRGWIVLQPQISETEGRTIRDDDARTCRDNVLTCRHKNPTVAWLCRLVQNVDGCLSQEQLAAITAIVST